MLVATEARLGEWPPTVDKSGYSLTAEPCDSAQLRVKNGPRYAEPQWPLSSPAAIQALASRRSRRLPTLHRAGGWQPCCIKGRPGPGGPGGGTSKFRGQQPAWMSCLLVNLRANHLKN